MCDAASVPSVAILRSVVAVPRAAAGFVTQERVDPSILRTRHDLNGANWSVRKNQRDTGNIRAGRLRLTHGRLLAYGLPRRISASETFASCSVP